MFFCKKVTDNDNPPIENGADNSSTFTFIAKVRHSLFWQVSGLFLIGIYSCATARDFHAIPFILF